ncbi:UPF0236 family protein [Caldifermentibacillus hisashii]|uniref:UPF0236 family transposase-like protein n=1 Tax=Caldifermentibacillus hisashii TaxID=996558 RepID=UPI0031FC3E15
MEKEAGVQNLTERDRKRYWLIDKGKFTTISLFDEIELKRNYYRDDGTREYVYLLDRFRVTREIWCLFRHHPRETV